MSKKVYVVSCESGVKIGVSATPDQRVKTLSTESPECLKLEYQTDFCVNAESVEAVCHIELSHREIKREWFDVSPLVAIEVVKNVFASVSIQDDRDSPRMASKDSFIGCIKDYIKESDGMYEISSLKDCVNEFRAKYGLGSKQISSFFNTESTKRAIAEICIRDGIPISGVKYSSKGRYGGTWVCPDLFSHFLRWASGISSVSNSDISQYK